MRKNPAAATPGGARRDGKCYCATRCEYASPQRSIDPFRCKAGLPNCRRAPEITRLALPSRSRQVSDSSHAVRRTRTSDGVALCREQVVAQQLVEGLRPLLGEENPRTRQLDRRLRSGDRLSEPMRPLHREVDVIRTPDDEG